MGFPQTLQHTMNRERCSGNGECCQKTELVLLLSSAMPKPEEIERLSSQKKEQMPAHQQSWAEASKVRLISRGVGWGEV